MDKFIPVVIGRGKKIHAAFAEHPRITLCGSGQSSFAHNFRNPVIFSAFGYTLDDINCAKCKKAMELEASKGADHAN